MRIPFLDLGRQHRALKAELLGAVERVLESSRFVLGGEGTALEAELAALAGVRHGIGVGSGTDALRLALTAVGVRPGDDVITPAFSFVASASTILMAGARPVFVDVDPATCALDPGALERALTPRTRAVVVVHLYGHPAPIDRIAEIARRHGVALVEDAAQAIGATWDRRPIGGWGDVACLRSIRPRTSAPAAMPACCSPAVTTWPSTCGACAITATAAATSTWSSATAAGSTRCRRRCSG